MHSGNNHSGGGSFFSNLIGGYQNSKPTPTTPLFIQEQAKVQIQNEQSNNDAITKEEMQNKITKLTEEIAKLREENQAVSETIIKTNEKNLALTLKQNKHKQELEKANRILENNKKLKKELTTANDFELNNKILIDKIKQLEIKLSMAEKLAENNELAKNKFQEEYKKLEQEYRVLNKRALLLLDEHEENVEAFKKWEEQASIKYTLDKNRYDELQNNNAKLADDYKQMLEENNKLQLNLTKLEKQMASLVETQQTLNEENKQLSEKNEALQKEKDFSENMLNLNLSKKSAQPEQYENQISNLQKINQTLTNDLRIATQRNIKLEQAAITHNIELDKCTDRIVNLEHDMQLLKQENNHLKQKNKEITEADGELRNKLIQTNNTIKRIDTKNDIHNPNQDKNTIAILQQEISMLEKNNREMQEYVIQLQIQSENNPEQNNSSNSNEFSSILKFPEQRSKIENDPSKIETLKGQFNNIVAAYIQANQDYQATYSCFSIFSRHGETGRKAAEDFGREYNEFVKPITKKEELQEYLEKLATKHAHLLKGNYHKGSFKTYLLYYYLLVSASDKNGNIPSLGNINDINRDVNKFAKTNKDRQQQYENIFVNKKTKPEIKQYI